MVYHHSYCVIMEGHFSLSHYKRLLNTQRVNTSTYHPQTDVPVEESATDILVEECTTSIQIEQSIATSKAKASGKGGGSECKWKDNL